MRIPNFVSSQSLIGNLQNLNTRQQQLQNQVSTGQRITQASDDPTAMGRVLANDAEKTQLQQYAKNTTRALDVSNSTYSAVGELKTISDRAGELAVLGTGTNGTSADQSYGTELNQMIEQGLQVVNTSYAGEQIFGGTKTDSAPFTATRDASGNITGVTYTGTATAAQINTSENTSISPYSDGATNQKFADFLNNLVSLRNALNNGDSSAVQATQPNLQTSENDIIGAVSDIGATQTRLEADSAQNQARFSQLENLTSKDTSADMATTVVKLTQTQTAYQAALQVGAQVLRVSLLNYLS